MAVQFVKFSLLQVLVSLVFLIAEKDVVVFSWSLFGKTNSAPTLESYPKTETKDGSLIWFQKNNESTYAPYITSLIGLTYGYDVNKFGPCGPNSNRGSPPKFGYDEGSPCIFLKIKLNNHKLEYYDQTNIPYDMPRGLEDLITSTPNEIKRLYISCQGADPASLENIGSITFYPTSGVADEFLHPDAKGYVDPIVAVRLQSPMVGVLINIECRMWAKNIDPKENLLQFGVMVD